MKRRYQFLFAILFLGLTAVQVRGQCTANWILETLPGDWVVISDDSVNHEFDLFGLRVENSKVFQIRKVNTNQFAFGDNDPVRIGSTFWYEPNPDGRFFCVCKIGEREVRFTEDENHLIVVIFGPKDGAQLVVRRYIRDNPILS